MDVPLVIIITISLYFKHLSTWKCGSTRHFNSDHRKYVPR